MTSTKGFKITDAERKLRVGIAAKNLQELKLKTITKFKLDLKIEEISYQIPDGTIIDTNDYFQTLQPQTLLIWVKKGERADTDAELIYKVIREVNDEYLTAGGKIQEFFTEKMKSKVFKLAEVLKGIDNDKTKLSLRSEDPEWFEGLDTNSKTKEEYMFRRAQDRIRTFYYKTKEDLLKNMKHLPSEQLTILLIELKNKLKLMKYHGYYFDRNSYLLNGDNMKSICNGNGDFICQGRWDKKTCLYIPLHQINPYSSKEGRIIFQTWNLDHGKERTRTVIPAIVQSLQQINQSSSNNYNNNNNSKCKNNNLILSLDIKSIYDDLFTMKNLKFVHIVCHDKSAHNTKMCESYLI